MFAAARMTDIITHDAVTPCGVIGPPISGPAPGGLVAIEKLPAAYVSCQCMCTGVIAVGIVHIPVPGPQPPIILGSMTVLINKLPAARWAPSGDMGVMGEQLGYAPLLPMRRTFLGGASGPAPGFPLKVTRLSSGRIQVGANIFIEGTPEFQAKVLNRLGIIASTSSGAQMLNNIAASGKKMEITEFTGPNSFAGPDSFIDATPNGSPVFDGAGNPVNSWWGLGSQEQGTGAGSDVSVQFNPGLNLPNSRDPSNPMPNDAILFHEMEHGSHQMNGTYDGTPVPGWTTQEEQNTISTGTPSEADYLRERGYPWKRNSHGTTWVPNP